MVIERMMITITISISYADSVPVRPHVSCASHPGAVRLRLLLEVAEEPVLPPRNRGGMQRKRIPETAQAPGLRLLRGSLSLSLSPVCIYLNPLTCVHSACPTNVCYVRCAAAPPFCGTYARLQ